MSVRGHNQPGPRKQRKLIPSKISHYTVLPFADPTPNPKRNLIHEFASRFPCYIVVYLWERQLLASQLMLESRILLVFSTAIEDMKGIAWHSLLSLVALTFNKVLKAHPTSTLHEGLCKKTTNVQCRLSSSQHVVRKQHFTNRWLLSPWLLFGSCTCTSLLLQQMSCVYSVPKPCDINLTLNAHCYMYVQCTYVDTLLPQ